MTWSRQQRLLLDTLLLGVVGALCARALVLLLRLCQHFFLGMIAGYRPPSSPFEGGPPQQAIGPHGLWLIPVATTLGGLIVGFLVYTFAPEAEGHGTDAVISAFHFARGAIRARVPFIKMVASVITIGSGGSAGREGPTALITAGIGSVYARWMRRSDQEVRILVLVGVAAGLSAVFRSPIGTAILAIEVLYREMDFEGGALFYTMVGSVVAYAVNGLFVGIHPLFDLPDQLASPGIAKYGWFMVLGVASGLVATVLPLALYSVRDLFRGLRVPAQVKPAIGGLVVGLIGIAVPQVLGGGYGWVQQAIDGRLTLALLFIMTVMKIVTFSLTIGSGGSGGVFAPSLYTGAMLGGCLGQVFHQPAAAFVVVGMASVFAGAARVPIATLLMVSEMTGDYQMLVPAALSVMLSYFVQASLSASLKYQSLYEAQVPTRADSPAHHAEHLQTAFALLRRRVNVPAEFKPLELLSLLASGVPVSLPGGKQLRSATIAPGSPCIGESIQSNCLYGDSHDSEIVLLMRGSEVVSPRTDTRFGEGDQVLLITTAEEWKHMAAEFAAS